MRWNDVKIKRQYKCKISGRVCPFNDDDWEMGGADDVATDNCPVQSYENNSRRMGNMIYLSDWCIHLIQRR